MVTDQHPYQMTYCDWSLKRFKKKKKKKKKKHCKQISEKFYLFPPSGPKWEGVPKNLI